MGGVPQPHVSPCTYSSFQILGGKSILPTPMVIVAGDGESEATVTAAAAPTKVAMDACGRPVTFLEVIHEVEVSQHNWMHCILDVLTTSDAGKQLG